MSLKDKLNLADFESSFDKLSEEKLTKIFGGGSCSRTGSSSSCDNTAVCNCPRIEKPKKPGELDPTDPGFTQP